MVLEKVLMHLVFLSPLIHVSYVLVHGEGYDVELDLDG